MILRRKEDEPPPPLFHRVGGEEFFVELVDRFYEGVAGDPLLRPLYPEDLAESRQWLTLFLVQYWGGPPAYNIRRGHPRLRGRHAPFAIGQEERDRWMHHMRAAVEASAAAEAEREELLTYFEGAATFMMNR